MGLHVTTTTYLPPFQVEFRRRLWWQIVILDARAGILLLPYVDISGYSKVARIRVGKLKYHSKLSDLSSLLIGNEQAC